jgi:hypothetical protein
MNVDLKERFQIEDFRANQLIKWIESGEKPAVLSFTAGNERKIAYAVEQLVGRILRQVVLSLGLFHLIKSVRTGGLDPWQESFRAILTHLELVAQNAAQWDNRVTALEKRLGIRS